MPFGVRTLRQAAAKAPQQITLSDLRPRLESIYLALNSGDSIKQRHANVVQSLRGSKPPPESEARHLHAQARIQRWSFPLQDEQNGEHRDQRKSVITVLDARQDTVNILLEGWFCDALVNTVPNAGNHMGKRSLKDRRREWIHLLCRCPEVAFNLMLICYWRPRRGYHQ